MVALLCQAVDDGTAGVSKVHDFGSFVYGFAGCVVYGLPQNFHVEVVAQQNYLSVASRYQ